MKLQNLAVIFVIIILPIALLLGEYTRNQIRTLNLQTSYDTKLTEATFDAIRAFQMNSQNSDTAELAQSRIRDVEGAINIFFNTMGSAFSMRGFDREAVREFVPAVVFTMYDGYFIYSPYKNTLDRRAIQRLIDLQIDENDTAASQTPPRTPNDFLGQNNLIPFPTANWDNADAQLAFQANPNTRNRAMGLKPFIHYSMRYVGPNFDVVIFYSLDNFITIQGIVNNQPVIESGYLLDDIQEIRPGIQYRYNGIDIVAEPILRQELILYENIGVPEPKESYYFIEFNNTRYFSRYKGQDFINAEARNEPYLLFTELNGKKLSVPAWADLRDSMRENDIRNIYKSFRAGYDLNAVLYYQQAYNLNRALNGGVLSPLLQLRPTHAVEFNIDPDDPGFGSIGPITAWASYDQPIFTFNSNNSTAAVIEETDSIFNNHRMGVIRHSVETNLKVAISNFNGGTDTLFNFQMPQLREVEWERIANNVTAISFLQGLPIGGKMYNGHAIVPNNRTKEVVQPENIFITTNDGFYHRVLHRNLVQGRTLQEGRHQMDFERRTLTMGDGTLRHFTPVEKLACYECIVMSNNIRVNEPIHLDTPDHPRRVNEGDVSQFVRMRLVEDGGASEQELARIFYTALARERNKLYRPMEQMSFITLGDLNQNLNLAGQADIPPPDNIRGPDGTLIPGGGNHDDLRWYNSNQTITLGTMLEGVQKRVYSVTPFGGLMEGPLRDVEGNQIVIDTEGINVVRIYNHYGDRLSLPTTVTIRIDKTAPRVTGVTGNATEWTRNDVTLSVTGTDTNGMIPVSNIASINGFSFDNGVTWQTSPQKTFTTNQTVNIRVRDSAYPTGNVSAPVQVVIDRIDKTPPSAPIISINPATPNGTNNWYRTNPSIVITAGVDNVGGSGVNRTTYTITLNGTIIANQTITGAGGATIPISQSGTYVVSAQTFDNVGNVSSTTTWTRAVNIDAVAPTIGAVSVNANGTITVTGIADTGGSGIRGYYVSTSATTPTATGVTWTPLSGSSFTFTPASGTWNIWVVDNAGNVSAVRQATVAAVARMTNGAVNTDFPTLQSAINAVPADNVQRTVTLLVNRAENVVITAGRNVNLNLNGRTLSASAAGGIIHNEGRLVLANDGTISNFATNTSSTINNRGTMVISGGTTTFTNVPTPQTGSNTVHSAINTSVSLTINGGTINNNSGYTIFNNSGQSMAMTNGTINHTSIYPGVINQGTFNLSGGLISSGNNNASYGSYSVQNFGSMTMSAGTVRHNNVNADTAMMNHATFNMTNGTIQSGSYGLVTRGPVARTTVTGGNINATGSMWAVYADNGGQADIRFTNIRSLGSPRALALAIEAEGSWILFIDCGFDGSWISGNVVRAWRNSAIPGHAYAIEFFGGTGMSGMHFPSWPQGYNTNPTNGAIWYYTGARGANGAWRVNVDIRDGRRGSYFTHIYRPPGSTTADMLFGFRIDGI